MSDRCRCATDVALGALLRRPTAGAPRAGRISRWPWPAFALAAALLGSLPVGAQAQLALAGTVAGPEGPLGGVLVRLRVYDDGRSHLLLEVERTSDGSGSFSASLPAGLLDLVAQPPAGSGLSEEHLDGVRLDRDLEVRLALARKTVLAVDVEVPAGVADGSVTITSLTGERQYRVQGASFQEFQKEVARDLYAVYAESSTAAGFLTARGYADCRMGGCGPVELTLARPPGPFLPADPPDASRITIGAADADGIALVVGRAGAVPGPCTVVAVNLDTHQLALGLAEVDGSFTVPLFAPPGATVAVEYDPTGAAYSMNELPVPSTLLTVATPAGGFGAAATIDPQARNTVANVRPTHLRALGTGDPGQWWITGTVDRTQAAPGDRVVYSGTLHLASQDIPASFDLTALSVTVSAALEKVSDAAGRERFHTYQFVSPVTTPTGLPIELASARWYPAPLASTLHLGSLRRAGPTRVEASCTLELRMPQVPAGYYRPALRLRVSGLPGGGTFFGISPTFQLDESERFSSLPPLRVGAPKAPRLTWLLALDDFANGSHGVLAAEDHGSFELAPHVLTRSDRLVLPLVDPVTGRPTRIRLEPFAPLVSYGGASGLAFPPAIPFRFPSGSLSARVQRPDGEVIEVGPAPFVQSAARAPHTRGGRALDQAPHVLDLYQLRTADPRFDFEVSQTGRYRITLEGTIEDVWGNTYRGGGTYEVWVAQPLDLEVGTLPGTPFEVGDAYSPAVVVQPGLAAEVTIDLQLLPRSAPERRIRWSVQGRANRFGFFQPVLASPLRLTAAGEYRVDVSASYRDAAGSLWMGTATWGSVVETPSSQLVTHGRRGFDGSGTIGQQWLRVRDPRPPGGNHLMFPFHRGDVMWMEKHDEAADMPKVTVQDPGTQLATRVRAAAAEGANPEGPDLEDRIAAGEIPMFSVAPGSRPLFDPEAIREWGYFYASVQRPGVRVRELISEDHSQFGYWRFNGPYNLQPGVGVNGDLPNDFKLQLGGAVYRDPQDDFFYYGAYASLFVLLPDPDAVGGRIFPPFQGNGGGPSGGPLMTLKGRAVDLFWHPTAVRPGSILEIGDTVSFAGYFAPTLPCKLELTVTSPSGIVRTLSRQANKIGYLYDPAFDFYADEPGRWTVKVHGFFDGVTSAGQVTAPFPSGDVLGTADGRFSFYVVRRDAPPLSVDEPEGSFVRPAEGAISVTLANPTGSTQTQVHETTTMPGFVLEQGQLPGFGYAYDAPRLAQDFPNLDLFDADGKAGVDTVTLSFLASGKDGAGADLFRARQILLQGEELFAPPQAPQWPCVADDTTLCLNGGRFSVTGTWRTATARGVAHAVGLTADSGYLWFFGRDNVEVLVKALDACGVNQRYWVFAAGLTDVEVELRVRDTLTGNAQVYTNAGGSAFAPLQDTSAFPTCGAPPAPGPVAPVVPPNVTAGSSPTCTPTATSLCLTAGRFRVEARWRTGTGANGQALASPLTADTGTFTFFDPSNVEAVVKVLDACSFPGAPRFWVFAAGLTNVEVVLTVTDTQSGAVKTYTNPLDRAFQPVQDTGAFATCS